MVWAYFAVLAIFFNVALSQSIRCPPCPNNCGPKLATTIAAPTIVSTTAPTIVDGNVVQSLIDTLQLFIVSDLLADTLPEKNCYVQNIPPTPLVLEYDDCGIEYELVFDNCTDIITDCICNPGCGCEYVTALVPRKCCSDQLILPQGLASCLAV
ncbi:uncharacterized protein LOC125238867 [Leguminivora glycinivorella]|uniref:uncharacterized protein LOC125238867 n=1 Tax=Leguminivora glycinivorella TaxID=1035111 RepID=UPI00200C456C|nr:uncharacterized protein LOC125238867 [Leguminivora glycinivorella]